MTDIYDLFKDLWCKPGDNTDCLWYEDCGEVRWTYEENVHDLINGNGDTHSADVYGESTERNGYVFYTVFDGCGDRIQMIFKLENKINPKDYEND